MNLLDNESNEIRVLLENDDTALGQVYLAWRESGESETLKEISNQSGIPYGTVASKIQIIKQLLQSGSLPSTMSQCRTIAKDIRRFIDRASIEIPKVVLSKFDEIAKILISRSEDPKLISEENRKTKKRPIPSSENLEFMSILIPIIVLILQSNPPTIRPKDTI